MGWEIQTHSNKMQVSHRTIIIGVGKFIPVSSLGLSEPGFRSFYSHSGSFLIFYFYKLFTFFNELPLGLIAFLPISRSSVHSKGKTSHLHSKLPFSPESSDIWCGFTTVTYAYFSNMLSFVHPFFLMTSGGKSLLKVSKQLSPGIFYSFWFLNV